MLNTEVDRRVDPITDLDNRYDRLREPEPNLPRRLFHFTDPRGLVGILSSGRLWASNADFLNDSSEPAHALGVLKAALDEVVGGLRPGSAAERAFNGCWDWAMNLYRAEGPHVYVFCMSEHDDLLSQWRSHGAQGAGYALGFSGRRLSELLQRPAQGLLRIVYDEREQRREAESVFKQIVGTIEKPERKGGPINRTTVGQTEAPLLERQLRNYVLSEIVRLRAKFKAPAFQEEGEWRIVQFVHPRVENPEVQFRSVSR